MAISVEIKNIEPMSVGADGAKLIQGPQGPRGEPGPATGIASAELISGTHAAGTSDTYRITYTDGKSFDFPVYNGADGKDGWDGEGAVRYDEEQSLDDNQKLQACDNISSLPGKMVYFWTDGPNTNNIWAILVYGGTGVVKNGDGNAPDGMTFPAFIVCGSNDRWYRSFAVYDSGGAIWMGVSDLRYCTIDSINRVDLSLGVTGATVGQIAKISAVDGTGTPTRWAAADMPAGLPDVTAADNGKFLRVVNGAWAAETVPNAGGASF